MITVVSSSTLYRQLVSSAASLTPGLLTRIWERERDQDPDLAAAIVTRDDCPDTILDAATTHQSPKVRHAAYRRHLQLGNPVVDLLNRESAPTAILGLPLCEPGDTDAAVSVAERPRSKRLAAYLATIPLTRNGWTVISRLATKAVASKTATVWQRLAVTVRNRRHGPSPEPDWMNDPDLAWAYAPALPNTDTLVDSHMWNPLFQAAVEAARPGPCGSPGSRLEHRTRTSPKYPDTLTAAELNDLVRRAPACDLSIVVTHPNRNTRTLLVALDRARQLRAGTWAILDQARHLDDHDKELVLAHALTVSPSSVHDPAYQTLDAPQRRRVGARALAEIAGSDRDTSEVLLAVAALDDKALTVDTLPTNLLLHVLPDHCDTVAEHLPESWDRTAWQLFEQLLDDGYAGSLTELIEFVTITSS